MASQAVQKILICGGGNASHVFATLAAALPNTTTVVLTLFQDEAERWTTAMRTSGGITIDFASTSTSVTAQPSLVTKDPSIAVPDSDVIIITVPAFAHGSYLEAIAANINKPAVLAVVPGSGGLEFQFAKLLGDKARTIALMACETLPWACRIKEYGVRVEVLGTKHEVAATCLIGRESGLDRAVDVFGSIQRIIGEQPILRDDGHIIGCTLGNHPEVHCAIMYDRWKEWDGNAFAESPLFYQGISPQGAQLMEDLSAECISIGNAVKQANPEIEFHMETIMQWFVTSYGKDVEDTSSLFAIITNNPSYNGLTHPCKQTDDGQFVPDFKHRYLGEDIPYGFVVMKGVALIMGVETPLIDEVLLWAQARMEKEYLVNGSLTGQNMSETRAPQVYGFTTLEQIFG